jgi:hypothetical protein
MTPTVLRPLVVQFLAGGTLFPLPLTLPNSYPWVGTATASPKAFRMVATSIVGPER